MAVIEDVFRKVAAFASFGFCKAHAASFAPITYQSAYLKAHHPRALYLGLLNPGDRAYPARQIRQAGDIYHNGRRDRVN
jgi:error-prone DNA polymerase